MRFAALALLGCLSALSSPASVRVTRVDGSVLDATQVISDFVLAGLGAMNTNTSYALSDNARFARASWDCGAWGTQGEVITQKVLSLGGANYARLARRWLLNTPQLASGEMFSTEGDLLHMGADGKWEANAEFILSAAAFARHAGRPADNRTAP